jgi:hypothetical protein
LERLPFSEVSAFFPAAIVRITMAKSSGGRLIKSSFVKGCFKAAIRPTTALPCASLAQNLTVLFRRDRQQERIELVLNQGAWSKLS